MKFLDTLFGATSAVDLLKEALESRGVDVRITPAGLREFARDAEIAAKSTASTLQAHLPYVRRLHDEIAVRADFLRTWTLTDDRIGNDPLGQRLAGLARKFALPRAWRVPEAVPVPARHPTPTYLRWTSAA
ncbi:MAG TPA: hypothetical protein VFS52_06490 [Steroidobacteraceae bacterium]|jgi:hypothetical protein|nr:hypothetical protein [Steroidobacteraceae bacterium]